MRNEGWNGKSFVTGEGWDGRQVGVFYGRMA